MAGFSRVRDEQNNLWVLCPMCFEYNEPVSSREGGCLSTKDGDTYDVCVDCATQEYLVYAAMMGA